METTIIAVAAVIGSLIWFVSYSRRNPPLPSTVAVAWRPAARNSGATAVPVEQLIEYLSCHKGAYVAIEQGCFAGGLEPSIAVSFPGEPKVLAECFALPATDNTYDYGGTTEPKTA